jgi:hypothetical protein
MPEVMMPNDAEPDARGTRAVSPDGTVPSDWVLEDIGHGFAQLRPPARLDEVPFPPDDPVRAADYAWAQDDPEVRSQYGGLFVAVRDRRVWGAGRTDTLAAEDAFRRPGCPRDLVFVYVWPEPPDEGPGRPTP